MPRYQERSPSPRAWLVWAGLTVAAWAAFVVNDASSWLAAAGVVGMVAAIAALAMWSTGRYGNITLTDSVLRVGRVTIRLEDVHPWGVSEPGDRTGGRIVGGGYAQTMGTQLVGLTMRDGTRSLVQSRNPDALRTALDAALVPFRAEVP